MSRPPSADTPGSINPLAPTPPETAPPDGQSRACGPDRPAPHGANSAQGERPQPGGTAPTRGRGMSCDDSTTRFDGGAADPGRSGQGR